MKKARKTEHTSLNLGCKDIAFLRYNGNGCNINQKNIAKNKIWRQGGKQFVIS